MGDALFYTFGYDAHPQTTSPLGEQKTLPLQRFLFLASIYASENILLAHIFPAQVLAVLIRDYFPTFNFQVLDWIVDVRLVFGNVFQHVFPPVELED